MAASTVTSIFLRRSVQSAAPRAHLLARKTLAAPALRCTAQRFRGFSSGVAGTFCFPHVVVYPYPLFGQSTLLVLFALQPVQS